MKKKKIILWLSLLLFMRCSSPVETEAVIIPAPVDSFLISGIDVGQQYINFKYLNEQTLSSYDLIGMRLVFFRKSEDGSYKAFIKKEINTDFWSMHFIGDDRKNYFADSKNTIIEYDANADSLLNTYQMRYRFNYLKDSFALACGNNTPILNLHDTLIAVISPNANESQRLYYKEQEISEFRLNRKTGDISFIRSYIDKPSHLSDYDFPLGMYCFQNNTISLIYPQIDTIYSFNRSTRQLRKIPVYNPDYKQPEAFPCKVFTPDYGACATKYYLHNFRYYGIHYNPASRHYVLFYNTAVKPVKGRMPTPEDQPLQALTLDESFRPLQRYTFNKPLEVGLSYFIIPGKGLAMPIYKGDKAYETTRFYIYNL